LSATGATARFAPRRAHNPRRSAAFRLRVPRLGAECEPGLLPVASEISRCAPPVSVFVKEGPKCVDVKPTYVSNFTPIFGNFI
jgi:hypothetical protein